MRKNRGAKGTETKAPKALGPAGDRERRGTVNFENLSINLREKRGLCKSLFLRQKVQWSLKIFQAACRRYLCNFILAVIHFYCAFVHSDTRNPFSGPWQHCSLNDPAARFTKYITIYHKFIGSVAEWLACWTQAQ